MTRDTQRTAAAQSAEGPIVLIGGATTPQGPALGAFVSLAQAHAGAHVVALTTASGDPVASARQWRRDLTLAGCTNLDIPIVSDRNDASDAHIVATVAGADAIFLGGGDQVKLVSIIGGTPLGAAISAAHRRGIVVGGTSAGAASLAKTTLAGNEIDSTGELIEQYIGPGLGLIAQPSIIDTHFSERRRLYRLFVALAEFPELLGLGIDEDTAMVIEGEEGRVVGMGGVTFVDARHVRYSNAGSRRHGAPLTLSAVCVGVVGAGHCFDFATRDLGTRDLALRDLTPRSAPPAAP